MCCEKRLRLGGSVQVMGCWVPRLKARMMVELGGLLVDC